MLTLEPIDSDAMFRASLPALLLVMTALVVSTGCSPSLSPLYRDYQVKTNEEAPDDVYASIHTALEAAGWEIGESITPNMVTTKERTMNSWGVYNVVTYLEVAPFGDGLVRVYVHPYRQYWGGARSKLSYMKRNLERIILSDLNPAFEEAGLAYIGTTMLQGNVAAR